uniref:Uncharacterized protein n=1 Tax=Sphaerodactylus townsendi TaxID=933632 RepID=A0ACB8GAF0_9SAUR
MGGSDCRSQSAYTVATLQGCVKLVFWRSRAMNIVKRTTVLLRRSFLPSPLDSLFLDRMQNAVAVSPILAICLANQEHQKLGVMDIISTEWHFMVDCGKISPAPNDEHGHRYPSSRFTQQMYSVTCGL